MKKGIKIYARISDLIALELCVHAGMFRAGRAFLPYNDIRIAKKMGVDRSNYSKAVNKGPITKAFLRKFYKAFRAELLTIENERKGTQANSGESQPDNLLQRLDGLLTKVDRLAEVEKEHKAALDSVETKVVNTFERITKIEGLISQLAMHLASPMIWRKSED